MFFRFLSRFETISVARTSAEKEAISRFAYDIYVNELGHTLPGTDQAKKVLWDEHDRSPNAIHLYAGTPDNIRAILRLLHWEPGQVNPHFFKTYAMHLFPNIEEFRTAEIGRLMVRPSMRGKLILPSLIRKAFQVLVGEYHTDLAFAECRPGLVRHYRKLGMRPYSAPLVRTTGGMMVPLVEVASDVNYQDEVNAITLDLARTYAAEPDRRKLDIASMAHLFATDQQRIVLNEEAMWAVLERPAHEAKPKVFDGLSDSARKTVTGGGLVLNINAGDEVAVKGRQESELFIVLEGCFEVEVQGLVVALIGAGEVFGEMAFFREDNVRSATVRARENGRVFVLSRRALKNLRKSDPKAAFDLLFNLGRILSDRLANQTGAAIAQKYENSSF